MMIFRQLSLMLCVGFLYACTPIVRGWTPLDHAVTEQESSAAVALAQRRIQATAFGRLLYQAELRSGADKSAVRYAVVYSRPSNLRIEALPTNGFYTLALLAITDGQALAIDPQAKEVTVAASPSAVLGRIFHVALGVEDVIAMVSGTLPQEVLQAGQVFTNAEKSLFEISSASGLKRYQVEAETGRLIGSEIFSAADDGLKFVVKCGDYTRVGETDLPQTIHIDLPAEDVSIDLHLSSSNAATPPAATLFTPPIPDEFAIKKWGDGGGW